MAILVALGVRHARRTSLETAVLPGPHTVPAV
jgi:hypothetical protein